LGELTMGVKPDADADLPAAVGELAAETIDKAAFLQRLGHRGSQEIELSQPRWSEDSSALDRMLTKPTGSRAAGTEASVKTAWERVATEAKLSPAQRTALDAEVRSLQSYLGLREASKHHLMRGYALIRRILVELDRRYELSGGIFYLTPDELPRLVKGDDLSSLIAARRRRRTLALSLDVPSVLFSDDLDAIGRPVVIAGADTLQGVPLSAGVA